MKTRWMLGAASLAIMVAAGPAAADMDAAKTFLDLSLIHI